MMNVIGCVGAVLATALFIGMAVYNIFFNESLGEDHFSEEEDDSQTGR